jgi:hypothetical protein
MRKTAIFLMSGVLAACATTSEPGSSQNAMVAETATPSEDRSSSATAAMSADSGRQEGQVVGEYIFVDGLPPEGQYNAVADENGTILRGMMVDSQGRVCRRERVTGSNIPELRCRTLQQWRAIQEAGQERIRHRQSTGYMFRGG